MELVNKLDPRDPWFKYELGITYQLCRRYQDAIEQYDKVIDLQPNLKSAYIMKSWALFNLLGETSEARAVLEAGRACNGRWPELTWLEVYYDLCDKAYVHALSLTTAPGDVFSPESPDTSDYYLLKGLTNKLMGRPQIAGFYFDSARVRLEGLLLSAPNSAPILSSLAYANAGLGHVDKAVSLVRLATELVPVSTDALEGPIYIRALAMIYAQVGQQDQAIELAAYLLTIPSNVSINALKLVPEIAPLRDNPRFHELLERYEQEHGT